MAGHNRVIRAGSTSNISYSETQNVGNPFRIHAENTTHPGTFSFAPNEQKLVANTGDSFSEKYLVREGVGHAVRVVLH